MKYAVFSIFIITFCVAEVKAASIDERPINSSDCKIYFNPEEHRECCEKIEDATEQLDCLINVVSPGPSLGDQPPATAKVPNPSYPPNYGNKDVLEILPPAGLPGGWRLGIDS